MENCVERAETLKKEAFFLLKKLNLIPLLRKYGNPSITGSYHYNLMTWNDIDICLEIDRFNLFAIFELGREIALNDSVSTLYYRNELVLKTEGNPRAIFWCVEVLKDRDTTWKIDILIAQKNEIEKVLTMGKDVMDGLNEETRKIILEIKDKLTKTDKYRKEYRSVDIYNAVLHENIKNHQEWLDWWETKKLNK